MFGGAERIDLEAGAREYVLYGADVASTMGGSSVELWTSSVESHRGSIALLELVWRAPLWTT